MAELSSLTANGAVRAITVDVFDTVLLRTTKPEYQRFQQISALQAGHLQPRGYPALDVRRFQTLRHEAARTVYHTKRPVRGGREAHWQEIMRLMLEVCGVDASEELLQELEQIELAYERQHLRLNQPLWDELQHHASGGVTVTFLSDMYLGSASIDSLIRRVSGRDNPFEVWSSADFGFGKGCESLFHEFAKSQGLEPGQICHLGDNYHSDFAVPRRLGMRAIYRPRPWYWKVGHRLRRLSY